MEGLDVVLDAVGNLAGGDFAAGQFGADLFAHGVERLQAFDCAAEVAFKGRHVAADTVIERPPVVAHGVSASAHDVFLAPVFFLGDLLVERLAHVTGHLGDFIQGAVQFGNTGRLIKGVLLGALGVVLDILQVLDGRRCVDKILIGDELSLDAGDYGIGRRLELDQIAVRDAAGDFDNQGRQVVDRISGQDRLCFDDFGLVVAHVFIELLPAGLQLRDAFRR